MCSSSPAVSLREAPTCPLRMTITPAECRPDTASASPAAKVRNTPKRRTRFISCASSTGNTCSLRVASVKLFSAIASFSSSESALRELPAPAIHRKHFPFDSGIALASYVPPAPILSLRYAPSHPGVTMSLFFIRPFCQHRSRPAQRPAGLLAADCGRRRR
jgi:hypothetical protein